MKWQDWIRIKADVCNGKACIKGRRVMVSVILASLAEGDSPETIMANYHLASEDIQAAVLFAADMAEDRFFAPAIEAAASLVEERAFETLVSGNLKLPSIR